MPAIFNALPGLEVPVRDISKSLARMWETRTNDDGGQAGHHSDAVKAMQVNFVLHLGFLTDAADAAAQFQTAVRFSCRHPCRVVVLCPLREDEPDSEFRAKIYGECHLGKTPDDMRCCEFVMLSYPMSARRFLESQVSVCLSWDLPLYYWVHRFSSVARLQDYKRILQRSRRVLFDSAVCPKDVSGYPWPEGVTVRDLVFSRLLHVRQAIGQFLSAYPPAALAEGLTGLNVQHSPDCAAEAQTLLQWAKVRLANCGVPGDLAEFVEPLGETTRGLLRLHFHYAAPDRFFSWNGDFAEGCARIQARLQGELHEVTLATTLLPPEIALSDAMFF